MAIITISRGTFSGGQWLAECIAEKLGYRCMSREVLAEASRQYGVEEERLSKALTERPGFLERMSVERLHYLAYIRAVLFKKVMDDLALSTAVRAAIAADGSIADGGIEVKADGGVVTLGGTVESLADADRIKRIALKVPGVRKVNSKMRV